MFLIFRKKLNIPAKDGHGKLLKVNNSEQLLGNVFAPEICPFCALLFDQKILSMSLNILSMDKILSMSEVSL